MPRAKSRPISMFFAAKPSRQPLPMIRINLGRGTRQITLISPATSIYPPTFPSRVPVPGGPSDLAVKTDQITALTCRLGAEVIRSGESVHRSF